MLSMTMFGSMPACRSLTARTAWVVALFAMTCDRTYAAGTLYWSSHPIWRGSSDGDCFQITRVGEGGGAGILDLDVDPQQGKVYFTREVPANILRCDLDGANTEVVLTTAVPAMGIDIDHVNRKLYWSDGHGPPTQNRIMRSNLDGSNVEQLYGGSLPTFGIATDPGGGKVYWSEGSFQIAPSGAIHRSNLDGSAHEQIVTLTGRVPIGIAIHHGSSKVYWITDAASGSAIYRANKDGSNVEQIFSGLLGLRQLDIDEEEGKLYFCREVSPADVYRCDLDGSGFVALGFGAAFGIAFVSEKQGFVCHGDTNSDLRVNVDDLLSVINSWGQCRSCAADFNGDGTVNQSDLLFVLNHWTI